MTFGDAFLLFDMVVLAAILVQATRADRAAGRRQVRGHVPVGRLWVGVVVASGFAALLVWFALTELATPGTRVVSSGWMRGAVVHHWASGGMALGIAGAVGWLAWTLLAEIRSRPAASRRAPPADPWQPSPLPRPIRAREVPTVVGALADWDRARAGDEGIEALSTAARDLAGAFAGVPPGSWTTEELVERVPSERVESLTTLLRHLDRARYAQQAPDLALLDICVDALRASPARVHDRG